jgi:hypothetical protein
MDKDIKDIIKKYEYDQKTRKYSHKYYFKDNSIYASIKNNDDVTRAYNVIVNNISHFENFHHDLVSYDIETLERALARYEEAIHKVLACLDNLNCDFNYSAEELIQLINNWDVFEEKISKIHMRKAFQD